MVLVTGSMRSGTSSLAGSLKHLGWHVPQPEVPASERNAKGHFEPRWVIEFHKRLMRGALVRPSDGSPRAEERVAALLEDGAVEAELRDWLGAQEEPNVVIKDPHAAWVLPLWRRAADAGRSRPADPHRAAPPGRGGRLAGPHLGRGSAYRRRAPGQGDLQHRGLAQRRAGHRGGFARCPRAFIRYDDLLADWRTALKQVSDQLDLALPLDEDHGLDAFLDPGMRRSQLTWDDIVLPGLAARPGRGRLAAAGRGSSWTRRTGPPAPGWTSLRAAYDAHYAEAVAVSLDEARHRERRGTAAGAAKLRGRLKAERARRKEAEAELAEGQTTKRLLGQIVGRSRSGNRDATNS